MPGRPARRVFHAGKAEAERAMRCPDGITGQSHYFERTLGRLIPEAQRADAEAGKAVPAGQEAADAVACNAHEEADAAERSRLERLQWKGQGRKMPARLQPWADFWKNSSTCIGALPTQR